MNRHNTVSVLLLLSIALLLGGCFDLLSPPDAEASALVILNPEELADGRWTVTILANDVPSGGLLGILIKGGGILFEDVIVESIEAIGLGGFVVTAQNFNEASPHGMLVAVNPIEGVTNGKILKLTFRARSQHPIVSLSHTNIVLLTDRMEP